MKKLSIGVRLTLWYLAIFALGELVFGAGMWFILRANLYDIVDDGIESQIDDLKNFLGTLKPDIPLSTLQQEVRQAYSIQHSGDYLALYNDAGDLVYRSSFFDTHPSLLLPPERLKRPVARSRRAEGHPFRFLYEKVSVNGRVFILEMGAPADDAVDTLHQFRNYLWIFAPLVLLAAAGVGYWISRKALAPVDHLVHTVREISGASLSTRLPRLETGDELQRLSDTLNEMLDRLEQAFSRVTQFTADASHELRTPISLMRTEAELALRRARGEEEYRDSLSHILAEAERTTGLIEQLLALARADSGREIVQMTPVDLRPMLDGIVQVWRPVAAMRGLQFSTALEASGVVQGDETLLRRLIDVLLDNAFKYTTSPGAVQLRFEQSGEYVQISVQDSGLGIEVEEQSKIFERFYRVDKVRSRNQGGAGLGLAIAHWVVTQHHGQISVESRPGEGSTFRVRLPKLTTPVADPQPV
jgi:heavy metal sensor kinase